MSTYGKYFPDRQPNEKKKAQRRHTTGTGLAKADTGIELSTGNAGGQNESTTDPPESEEKTPKTVVQKSYKRFRNALLPQVGGTHKTFRLLWILIYLGLTVVFLYSFQELLKKYFAYPTTSELILEIDDKVTFPSVTVCNENPVRKSSIGRYRVFADLLLLDKYVENKVEMSLLGSERQHSTKCPPGKKKEQHLNITKNLKENTKLLLWGVAISPGIFVLYDNCKRCISYGT